MSSRNNLLIILASLICSTSAHADLNPAYGLEQWCIEWAISQGHDPTSPDCPECPCSASAQNWDEPDTNEEDEDPGGTGDDPPGTDDGGGDGTDDPGGTDDPIDYPTGKDCTCLILAMINDSLNSGGQSLGEHFEAYHDSFNNWQERWDEHRIEINISLDEIIEYLSIIVSLLDASERHLGNIDINTSVANTLLAGIMNMLNGVYLEVTSLRQTVEVIQQGVVENNNNWTQLLTESLPMIQNTLDDSLAALNDPATGLPAITAYLSELPLVNDQLEQIQGLILSVDEDLALIYSAVDDIKNLIPTIIQSITTTNSTLSDIYTLLSDFLGNGEDGQPDPPPGGIDPPLTPDFDWLQPQFESMDTAFTELTNEAITFENTLDQYRPDDLEESPVFSLNFDVPTYSNGSITLAPLSTLLGAPLTADFGWMQTTNVPGIGLSLRTLIHSLIMIVASIGAFTIIQEEVRRYG